ncbi:hypothetical protein MASR2M78_26180 [Treponema sp.]
MYGSIDWKDIKYEETLEQELRGLKRRRAADPSCTVADIEGVLRDLYNMEGSDWVGRGELGDLIMKATIAAYERFVFDWKAELVV